MGRISNILTMIELLSSNRKYTIEELSNKLEVTPRMIRFYKEEMDKAGIYVDTIRGPYGGYVLNQSIRMPSRKFKYEDFKLLESITKQLDDEALKNEMTILSDKVRGIYQGSKEETKELNLDNEMTLKYNAITRAVKEKRKVKILYYSYQKGENERIIHPYDMYLYNNGWGIGAYCEKSEDIRHFELKRIIKYELLNEIFK